MGVREQRAAGEAAARILFSVVMIATVAAVTLWSWLDYRRSMRDAETFSLQMARAVEANARRTLTISRNAADHVSLVIGGRDPATLGPRDHAQLRRDLGSLLRGLDDLSAVWVTDTEGRVVFSSFDLPGPVSLADREHFQLVKAGKRLHISPLIEGKVGQGTLFVITSRLEDPAGRFLGAVAVSLSATRFSAHLAELDMDDGTMAGLLHEDGRPLARHPWVRGLTTITATGIPAFTAMPTEVEGHYETRSFVDGTRRIYGFRRVAEFPAVAVVGVSREQVLAGWLERQWMPVTVSAVLMAVVFVLWRRVVGALADSNRARGQLSAALAEKDVLLSEVHHRVKNNLQIVQSLLMMARMKAGEDSRAGYDDSLDRIQAMGLVHEQLYLAGDFSRITCREYLERLCQLLVGSHPGVELEVHADDLALELDRAVPFAMAVNEMVSNALKHGMPEEGMGRVAVHLVNVEGTARLTVADNGRGLPDGFDPGRTRSLGMMLLSRLASQLGGAVDFHCQGGTRATLCFAL